MKSKCPVVTEATTACKQICIACAAHCNKRKRLKRVPKRKSIRVCMSCSVKKPKVQCSGAVSLQCKAKVCIPTAKWYGWVVWGCMTLCKGSKNVDGTVRTQLTCLSKSKHTMFLKGIPNRTHPVTKMLMHNSELLLGRRSNSKHVPTAVKRIPNVTITITKFREIKLPLGTGAETWGTFGQRHVQQL